MKNIILTLFMVLFFNSCGGGSSSSTPVVDSSKIDISMNFTRVEKVGLDSFVVKVAILNNGVAVNDAQLTPILSDGNMSNIVNHSDGNYSFEVTPSKTGEYDVTVEYKNQTLQRTALVLQDTHSDWGQAQSVSGLVNTEGYEDGVTITPDGEYLFVQTGPYTLSAIFVYNEARVNGGCGGSRVVPDRCTHPWINELVGTYSAPQRPNYFNRRFDGNRQLHNAASWGLGDDETPNFAMTTMFYGFKKQSDGSFAEPFYMAFDDLKDGISSPFGLSFLKQPQEKKYTTIFTLKDAYTTDFGFDIYSYDATFEEDNIFGTYALSSIGNAPVRTGSFSSTLVDMGDNSGTQGNPFLYAVAGDVKSIWTDDEYDNDGGDRDKVSVHVLNSGEFRTSNDWTKVILPESVNVVGKEARQPSFVNGELFFAQDVSVVMSEFSANHTAADLGTSGNWSSPEVILQKDTSYNFFLLEQADIGKIIAVGEPTLADVNGTQILYFVYGQIRGIDPLTGYPDVDMQAGFIEKNP